MLGRRPFLLHRAVLIFGGLALASGVARAVDETNWYVTAIAGYEIADSERNVDDDFVYGLAIGKALNRHFSLELEALTSDHNDSTSRGFRLTPVSLDVLLFRDRNKTFAPYISAGVGMLDVNPAFGGSQKDFMEQIGLGVLIHVMHGAGGSYSFNLRPEAKARWDNAGTNGHLLDYWVGVGFELYLGSPEEPAPVVAAPLAPPLAPPPAPPPAPLDSDGDGVPDERDRCPDTPRGSAVDESGCPRRGSVTLTGVNFENDSAVLTADSRTVLDRVAMDLGTHPRLRVELQGHTDSTGSDAYNLRLSQRRAESVRDYLVGRGVASAQLEAKGYGESTPIADNSTPDGRASNRRVVMRVIENPGSLDVSGAAPR